MYRNLDGRTFEEELHNNADAILIDVRTPMEYEEGHLPDAKLINVASPDFQTEISKLDPNKSYYLYCRSGARSGSACNYMSSMGFKKVANLAGGIFDWEGEIVE